MTATTTEDLHECACGCGEMVKGEYKRGHWARAQAAARLMPGPDAAGSDLDSWVDIPDMDPEPGPAPQRSGASDDDDEPEEVRPDPEPAHLRAPKAASRPRVAAGRTVRATAAVQKDVNAKIRMITFPLAKVSQMRDPWCGGAFVQQEPEIAAAFTTIVCQSTDLLNFFTGTTGRYMIYFELFMACLPVGMAVYGHHFAHQDPRQQDGVTPPQPAPDMSRFAA